MYEEEKEHFDAVSTAFKQKQLRIIISWIVLIVILVILLAFSNKIISKIFITLTLIALLIVLLLYINYTFLKTH